MGAAGKIDRRVHKGIYDKQVFGNEPVMRFLPNGDVILVYPEQPKLGSPTVRGGILAGESTERDNDRYRYEEEEYATQP